MPLRHLPIQRKLVGFVFYTSLSVLVGSLVVLFWFETLSYRQTTVRGLTTLGDIIAANSAAALIYDDQKSAAEMLSALRSEPDVAVAALFTAQGRRYAVYPANGTLPPLPLPHADGTFFMLRTVVLFQPVYSGNQRVGTLEIVDDLGGMYRRLSVYGVVLIIVLLGALVLAYFLSNFFQRQISQPILDLAETARSISERKDYSVRARKRSTDELGFVVEAFNAMLEQIQASQAAMHSSELQLRLVTDNAAIYLCQIDAEHRYRFVNRAYARRHGLEPAAIVGRHLTEVLGPQAYHALRDRLAAAFAGQRVDFESELHYADIGLRWIHAVYEPERGPQGRVVGVVAAISDITDRWRSEQELKRARDEAIAASRTKDDFLAALSHELRTPLSPVLLLATEEARNPALAPSVRADFEVIRKNVELEARLIDDLLDLTRITNGKMILEMRVLDPQDPLRDAVDNLRSEVTAKHIKLSVDLLAGPAYVLADPVRLQQVFWNVLKNAVKFTPDGGAIRLRAQVAGGLFRLEVADTGIGLSPAELSRVFEAFTQGEHAREGGSHYFGGLGLGLAISRKVLELQAGRITAASPGRDQGSTFVIEMPLTELASAVPAAGGETPPGEITAAPAAEGSPRPRRCFLLIEDHAATRAALERLLVRRNFRVVTGGSVAEARALAAQERIDFVISDIGLPDGNGYDLMMELRTQYGLKGLALTGYGMESDVARSQAAGFVAHLTKPVGVSALDKALSDLTSVLVGGAVRTEEA